MVYFNTVVSIIVQTELILSIKSVFYWECVRQLTLDLVFRSTLSLSQDCSKGAVLGKPFSAADEDISKVVGFIKSRLVACYLKMHKPDLALLHSHR